MKVDEMPTGVKSPLNDLKGTQQGQVDGSPMPDGQTGKRWGLQDWISMFVALSLCTLFCLYSFETWREWPSVMNQIESARASFREAEEKVRDPLALKSALEANIENADKAIDHLRSQMLALEEIRSESAAEKALHTLNQQQKRDEAATQRASLNEAITKKREEASQQGVDFSVLTNGPGPEPDPSGPNLLRSEWRDWKVRNEFYQQARQFLGPAEGQLQSALNQLNVAGETLKAAALKYETACNDIRLIQNAVNEKLKAKGDAELMLTTSLVEADKRAVEGIEEARQFLRENEAARAALQVQDLPTLAGLFLVSVSALIRFALLRGLWGTRTLIQP